MVFLQKRIPNFRKAGSASAQLIVNCDELLNKHGLKFDERHPCGQRFVELGEYLFTLNPSMFRFPTINLDSCVDKGNTLSSGSHVSQSSQGVDHLVCENSAKRVESEFFDDLVNVINRRIINVRTRLQKTRDTLDKISVLWLPDDLEYDVLNRDHTAL